MSKANRRSRAFAEMYANERLFMLMRQTVFESSVILERSIEALKVASDLWRVASEARVKQQGVADFLSDILLHRQDSRLPN